MGLGEERVEWVADRLGHDRRYSVDCSKIKHELGYEPQESLESSLAGIVEWYRSNPGWWQPLKHGPK
jgi:dTDP-glucose 4,6-dehydratase